MDTLLPFGSALLIVACLAICAHVLSALLAARRLRPVSLVPPSALPNVTVIRPVCGLDAIERVTLASTFRLPVNAELIFCVANASDVALPYLRSLVAQYPGRNAHILIGTDGPGANPKLDNVRKGWRAASYDWVVVADSNVMMDDTYVWNLLSAWRSDAGAVCAPPLAIGGTGFWAEVETQYLNTYQARWQYAADALGQAFAQGKSMLFRKSLLDGWGGIALLDCDTAEDAATTRIVRRHALRVRLATATVPQPLGLRSFRQIWQRQCRWAQLRRRSFPSLYVLEPLTMLLPVSSLAGLAGLALDSSPAIACALLAVVWFAAEALMAAAAGWPVSMRSAAGSIVRELLAPLVWLAGLRTQAFSWRQPTLAPLHARPA